MSKLSFSLVAIGLFLPFVTFAHSGDMMDFTRTDDSFDMMRYVEDQVVGDEVHEEMEDLMVKMMSGNMTEEEAQRMVELMEEYPGASGMMSARMMGMGMMGGGSGFGMMDGGFNSGSGMMGGFGMMPGFGFMEGGGIFFWIIFLVWLVVGILAIIWLAKKIWK